jgi:hypothetical protein
VDKPYPIKNNSKLRVRREPCAYWIRRVGFCDIDEGYIWIIGDFERRRAYHLLKSASLTTNSEHKRLYESIRRRGVDAFEFVKLNSGLDEVLVECLEFSLRSKRWVGLNIAVSGSSRARNICCSLPTIKKQIIN